MEKILKTFLLVITIITISPNFISLASDFSSTNFGIKDGVFNVFGGNSTSTTFSQTTLGGQNNIGVASSTNFKVEIGALYYSSSTTPTPAPSPSPSPSSGGGVENDRLKDLNTGTQQQLEILEKEIGDKKIELETLLSLLPKITAPPTLIKEIKEKIKLLPEFLKLLIPETFLPQEEAMLPKITQATPLPLQNQWNLISVNTLNEFVLAPLPASINLLAQRVPEFDATLKKLGVNKISDITKLDKIKITLPNSLNLAKLPKFEKIPLQNLPLAQKRALPPNIVFASGGNNLINIDINVFLNNSGQINQKIDVVVGQPLHLAIKPEKPVKKVTGYILLTETPFQSPTTEIPMENLTASFFFQQPELAQINPQHIKTKPVVQEFEYTDPDNDGIFTTHVNMPLIPGTYETITLLEFTDETSEKIALNLITVIDPSGYVYEKINTQEARIPEATITLYWLNPQTNNFEIWSGNEYLQENPQITNNTGEYSFLVPEGQYLIKVEAPGYLTYSSKPINVTKSSNIHDKIELKSKYYFLKIIDWKVILLIVVVLLLLFNFYQDKIRDNKK